MSCKTYKYKGSELNEKDLIRALALDNKIIESYKSQEERAGSDYEAEDRVTFERKVDALKRTMNVEVIYDDNIESSRLLGRNDPRTKAAGKPVILINPNQLFKTTAIHEFGHVFIDAFPGGLENKRLQKALDQLRDTELWAEVETLYPELSESMLHKEILVTAIGREGAQIWADGENQNKWESFMAWLSDYLKRALGLERSEITALSKELLNNKVKDINVTQIEEIAQQLKPTYASKQKNTKTEAEKGVEKMESKIEKQYTNLLGVIEKIYKNQKKDNPLSRKREKKNVEKNLQEGEGRETRLESITNLREKLNSFDEASRTLGFLRYIKWAGNELFFMKKEIDRREDNNTLNDEALKKAYNWRASFGALKNVQNLLEELRTSGDITETQLESIRARIGQLNGFKDEIDVKLLKAARATYAKKLAKHDTQTEEEWKLGFKNTYKELIAAGTDLGMQEGEYIIQEIQANKDEIEAEKLEKAEERALRSTTRMSGLSMVLLTEKEMRAKDTQAFSTILDSSSRNSEKFNTEEATNEDAMHKKFREHSSSRNMKKKYEGMIVVSKEGTSYYTGEYKPEFIEEKNRVSIESGDPEIYDEKYKDVNLVQVKSEKGDISYEYESTVLSSKSGKVMNRTLKIKNATEIKVEGFDDLKKGERAMHVSFKMVNGKRMTISLNEAIARSEKLNWNEVNIKKVTQTINGKKIPRILPIDSWKDDRYEALKKDPIKFAELERLKENNRKTDVRYGRKDSISQMLEEPGNDTYPDFRKAEFMRLPGVMKTTASRIAEGQSLKEIGNNAISRLIETQEDDFNTETYADFKEGETLRIPTPYRSKLKETDQSYDLHTIGLLHSIMGKNYEEKQAIESTLLVMMEVMAEKQYPVMDGLNKQKIDKQSGLPMWESGIKSEEYAKNQSVLENRLYGITSKKAKEIKLGNTVIETQQVAKTALKYFGGVSLIFNYANSIVNTGTGTFSNLIEAVGGDVYNLKDYRKAQRLYNFDLKNIMKDMGANVNESKTNLLNSNFNTMGPAHLKNNFEEGSRVEGLMNQDSLRPFANMGEHMMQSKVMYAVLSSIKVQNAKGTWIDINGAPTTSKAKAASLVDMITFKKNAKGGQEMVLHASVQNTSFTTSGGQDQIILEARNLIRSKVDELHGQYNSDIQAHAQRYMLGKMGFFLRKWMIPGYIRRFRGIQNSFKHANAELSEADEFYSSDQKDHMEGYYISTVRFLSTLVRDTKENGVNVAKAWKELTPRQQAGVRKTAVDVAFMMATMLAYGLLEGEDGDVDDEDVFWAYLLRRQQSELMTFANPIEAFKLFKTPTAAVGNLDNIFSTLNYMNPFSSNWGARYKVGENKGELKILSKAGKLVPWPKNMADFKVSLDYLNGNAQ